MLGWFKPIGRPSAFEERAPHERGFAAHFERTIVPRLHRLELLRRVVLVVFWIILAIGLPLAGVVAVLAVTEDMRFLKGAIIVLLGAIGLALVPVAFFVGREERLLLPALCDHFGDLTVWIKPRATAAVVAPFRALGLLPPLDQRRLAWRRPTEKVTIDDVFNGSHGDVGLWMAELEDSQKQAGREATLFRGTLIAFGLPGSGHADEAWRVHAPDAREPGRLEVDAGGATPALATPAVLEALGALGRVFAPASFVGSFDDNVLRLALALKGRSRPFDVGNPFRPVYRCEPAVRATLAQLAAVRAVMAALADAVRAA
ncbi:MAG: hypothetical protein HY060_06035 [Proteobacteria bacterium]|nr:hypothetical protein [Pseudomonadota bacterium]